MPFVLLRPRFLATKNCLLLRCDRGYDRLRRLLSFLLPLAVMVFVYISMSVFLERIHARGERYADIPEKFISLSSLSFFFLLFFSNSIAAVGSFVLARDLELFIAAPISKLRLYLARLGETIINSSWLLLIFGLPIILAFWSVFRLPTSFLVIAAALTLPFIIIPAAMGGIIGTLFVAVFRTRRVREFLGLFCLLIIGTILSGGNFFPEQHFKNPKQLRDFILFFTVIQDPHPEWLPSYWVAQLLTHFLGNKTGESRTFILLLVSTTVGILALGYLVFEALFMRVWQDALQTGKLLKLSQPRSSNRLSLLPWYPQFQAILYKDIKMFARDVTQCLQLLVLLMVTFLYLYNFRTLRSLSTLNEETELWWRALLCIVNVFFGGCVIVAISVRFIFPCVSYEGFSYFLLRAAPLSIGQFLQNKFFVWLPPAVIMSSTLMLAGAWAIQVSPTTVLVCFTAAVAISVGIVGLAVGIGAVYAKFDWEYPTQVVTSFGGLVYIFLALLVVMITLLPVAYLVVVNCVPGFLSQLSNLDLFFANGCALILMFLFNIIAAAMALKAGEQVLTEMEG